MLIRVLYLERVLGRLVCLVAAVVVWHLGLGREEVGGVEEVVEAGRVRHRRGLVGREAQEAAEEVAVLRAVAEGLGW